MNHSMCKKVYLIVLLLTVISPFGRSIKFNNISDYERSDKTFREVSLKYILQWFWEPHQEILGEGRDIFLLHNCPVSTCYVTSNASYLKSVADFDAITFYSGNIPKETEDVLRNPVYRSSHQKYIFMSDDSSKRYPICHEKYDSDYFNWTFTYKLDSDEYFGYIIIKNSAGEIIGPNQTMHWMKQETMDPIDNKFKLRLSSKTKAAAWIVSNCKTLRNRNLYVTQVQAELDKYGLHLDIFGACGSKKCGTMKDCLEMVRSDYYFYFAIENSISEDFVTEKLLTALWNDAIPVVFGGANYTRFMPGGMYLDGGRMEPRKLAIEMRNIIQDKQRYYGFFRWRNHYSYYHAKALPETNMLCRMCALLDKERQAPTITEHKNFVDWWNSPKGQQHCDNITLIPKIKRLARTILNDIQNPKNDRDIPWKLFGIFLFGGAFWLPNYVH